MVILRCCWELPRSSQKTARMSVAKSTVTYSLRRDQTDYTPEDHHKNLKMILFGSDGFSSFFFGGLFSGEPAVHLSFGGCKGTWTPESLDDLFLCRSWRSCKIRTLWRRPLRHPVARAWLQELLNPPAKRTTDWLEKNNPGFEDVSPIVKSWFSNVISPFRWVGGEEILFF